ncbi:hypothetical protein [Plebeiibacterium sediminum]|uniref:Uncharacterized protein n=1 Tax=Plebeiibacterium sediminum TaxID=2992112 RepID=A0AAE3SIS0_9BACT|nr:hypothetical protein [Plebeiobacterium sediminum]MCW3789543.1 hypothetical protein [Plebeiobacterium sediminum]
MEHPIEKYRKSQKEFLKNCPESQRKFHEYMFRIGNATYAYHNRAIKEVDEDRQREYYKEWLEGLPENLKKDMKEKGFDGCKTALPFTRYLNERTDVGMTDWMKEHLSEADFKEWLTVKERNEE